MSKWESRAANIAPDTYQGLDQLQEGMEFVCYEEYVRGSSVSMDPLEHRWNSDRRIQGERQAHRMCLTQLLNE